MTEQRISDYRLHMRAAAEEAISFIGDMDKADFFADLKTQRAVVLSLIILGEAAAKVMDRYPDYAQQNAQLPWVSMRGMRNRLAHGYFEINLDLVWDTVHIALRDLLTRLP